MAQQSIVIRGAREHNLKNISLTLPRDKLIVITGLSGSGKSSLAFDTLYAEGQRRYVESLSAYARQFLGQMEKPDVDSIEGLSPAIAIQQKSASHNPRSTVGTVTEIYDYLRLLFARIGAPHCTQCGRPIARQTSDQIVDHIMAQPEGAKLVVMAPVIRGRKGEYKGIFDHMRSQGFVRVRVDGVLRDLSEDIKLEKTKKHSIEVVVDRLAVSSAIRKRLADSVDLALKLGQGVMSADINGTSHIFSQALACPECGISLEELTPRLFSFNSPFGACPACNGLGVVTEMDPRLAVDENRSLSQGAIRPWDHPGAIFYHQMIKALSEKHKFRMDLPFKKLSVAAREIILNGIDGDLDVTYYRDGKQVKYTGKYPGVIEILRARSQEGGGNGGEMDDAILSRYVRELPCESCHGTRLKPEAMAVTVADKSIHVVTSMSVKQAQVFFETVDLTPRAQKISGQVLKEIKARLKFLGNVGLDYLTLSRAAGTLSGGESQRIHLATQIGSSLVGVLYILDEPSIGLHQRDNSRLLTTLKTLRDLGNTVVVVEHDAETMEEADYIVDLGPGAGEDGGHVVATGTPAEIMRVPASVTGQYMSGAKEIPVPGERRKGTGKWLVLKGARENNLKGDEVRLPLGTFICVCGVSGSGKSSLVSETLYPALIHELYRTPVKSAKYASLEGIQHLDKVIVVDQSPIGRTPRSNPATYTGAFNHIRNLFSSMPDAKVRGYGPGRFSFNVQGGRCEACQGDGILKIEMHFLPDVYIPCEVCKGKRYNRETLEIVYKGRSIAEVLNMTAGEAADFFSANPPLARILSTIREVGLGYIKLGQPANTLSGGEAQRVKLSTELCKRSTGRTFYMLDEPTTGLHFDDVRKLLEVLNRLVDSGNTVLVIEHNLDVIKTADYIVDLGPEGGDAGGRLVAAGTPEQVVAVKESLTGRVLAKRLNDRRSVSPARG
jgi:excinuclease ABC subunit A